MNKIYALILTVLISQGCVDMFTARTMATYRITTTLSDGTTIVKDVSYDSNKQQDGLELNVMEKDGQPTAVSLKVDKASTDQAAIAATAKVQAESIGRLLEFLSKSVAMGAGS